VSAREAARRHHGLRTPEEAADWSRRCGNGPEAAAVAAAEAELRACLAEVEYRAWRACNGVGFRDPGPDLDAVPALLEEAGALQERLLERRHERQRAERRAEAARRRARRSGR
jgi:hypothetical protein